MSHNTHVLPEHRRRVGFISAAGTFVAVLIASATPFPLYGTYGKTDGITPTEFSLVAVAYFALAVLALVVLGRLSNHLGRKPLTYAAVAIAIAGCIVMMMVNGFPLLFIGRGLQGLAAGIASSAIAAYAVDTAPKRPAWLAGTVSNAAVTIGLAIGALGAGALVQFGPAPRVLVFWIAIGILVACAIGVSVAPETVRRSRGARLSLIPRLRLPAAARPLLPVATAVFVATWGLGGYYQSFGPSVAMNDLKTTSSLVAAAVVASYFSPAIVGGLATGRLSPAGAQRVGMSIIVLAVLGLIGAIVSENAVLFLVAGVLGGIGGGAANSGSARALLAEATSGERAGVLTVVYAISYAGAAVPSLIAGQLARTLSLLALTIGFACLAALGWLFVIILARNPKPL